VYCYRNEKGDGAWGVLVSLVTVPQTKTPTKSGRLNWFVLMMDRIDTGLGRDSGVVKLDGGSVLFHHVFALVTALTAIRCNTQFLAQ